MISSLAEHNTFGLDFNDTDYAVLIEDEFNIIKFVNQSFCYLFEIPLKSTDLAGNSSKFIFKAIQNLLSEKSNAFFNTFTESSINCFDKEISTVLTLKNGMEYLIDINPTIQNSLVSGQVWVFRRENASAVSQQVDVQGKDFVDLKSKFIGMVSHEFRTPLAAISSSIEIIEMVENLNLSNSKVKVAEHTSKISLQLNRMTELLDDVLLLNDIQNSNINYSPMEFDLLEMVHELKDEYAYCDFDIFIQTTSNKVLLNADRNLIKIAMLNLFSNAIKYSTSNRILDINLSSDELGIKLVIKDYGIGIPANDQSKLFQTFYRASNVNNIPGSGLGLVIIKHLLDLHKAKIDFKSLENRGSEFILHFPRN